MSPCVCWSHYSVGLQTRKQHHQSATAHLKQPRPYRCATHPHGFEINTRVLSDKVKPNSTRVPWPGFPPDVCTGDIPGIESADGQVCCVAECGQCGGTGCSSAGPASECCVTDIISSGVLCSETETAPCTFVDGMFLLEVT